GPGPRIFPDAALVPARSRSKDTIPAARFTTRTYALSCWSSALRFPRAFCRGTRKCQPCHKRREFFVLAPGRTKHPPQFGQTAFSHPISLLPQLVNGHFDSVARQPLAGVQTLLDPSLRFLQVETFGEVIGLHRTSCGTIG